MIRLKNSEREEICKLYNEVGDLSMLEYIDSLNIQDNKLQYLLQDMFELNEKMLDTDIYYANRREFLNYLNFDWGSNGNLIYKEEDINENYYYIIFVLGRDLIRGIIPYENDLAYSFCKEVANDFEKSTYNVNYKGLYECLEEYVKNSFYLQNGELTWKGEKLNERFAN